MTLAEFLLARIAEDEFLARDAQQENLTATWETDKTYDGVYMLDLHSTHPESDSYGMGDDLRMPREMARHIAHNSPARVLAECEAKRRIVEAHAWVEYDDEDGGSTDCEDCLQSPPCRTLRLLALPHAGREDYRQEWRP